jgi:SAM-dependent methyltransferase
VRDGDGLPDLTGGCRHPGGLELTERSVELAGLPRGAAVLDVGCGDGVTAEHLAERFGLRVVGVDESAALVRQGRERCPGLDLREGSAERLSLPDTSVDAVLAECVLSILDEPGAAVDEWARVLRPGGRLLVSDLFRRADPDAARRLLTERGFAVETWEDHSGVLARLVWDLAGSGALGAREPAAAAFPPAAVASAHTPVPAALRAGGGLGYYLCVARRDGCAVRRGDDAT